MTAPSAPRVCVGFVTHVLNAPVRAVFERLRREAPADHDVLAILSSDDQAASLAGLEEAAVERITRAEFKSAPYPGKCFDDGWAMSGNLDLVFLEFVRRRPGYDQYWFVEYDVHWEGVWSVFFEHFRNSPAAVLAATVQLIDDVPHKEHRKQPRLVVPPDMVWERDKFLKAFMPLCRIDKAAFAALDRAYRAGLGGHYELTLATVARHAGLEIEDFGGGGRFVRPENRNRFYFANGATFTHAPGTFVFRPDQRVLPRRNTLWHPVKPEGVPLWHPLRMPGNPLKSAWEQIKPYISRQIVRLWFATRWRPLRDDLPRGPA